MNLKKGYFWIQIHNDVENHFQTISTNGWWQNLLRLAVVTFPLHIRY